MNLILLGSFNIAAGIVLIATEGLAIGFVPKLLMLLSMWAIVHVIVRAIT